MDCIIKKLNENIDISDINSYEHVTYLRARIEYSLFFILGYLWNKNRSQITQETLREMMSMLNRISIGQVIGVIRKLDIDNEIVSRKVNTVFEQYPHIRNSKIGHGYAMSEQIINDLESCYQKMLQNIPLLNKPATLILVEKKQDRNYIGLRISHDDYGRERWTCDEDKFLEEKMFPRLYVLIEGEYYKLSPFVMLLKRGQDAYVFSSLEDTLSGSITLCPLFDSVESNYQFPELTLPNSEDDRIISTTNNSVMNKFEVNYTEYYDVGIKKLVSDFLKKNEASVTVTIWGHGGVGKTACIQSVCKDLFLDINQDFAYIIFITAKDRVFNTPTGKIIENENNYVRYYSDIIQEINKTVFNLENNLDDLNDLQNIEQKIIDCKQKMLIVIDDYETFADGEKAKISAFIKRLKIQHHKVVITTRNNRFIIGETISTNELNEEETQKFLKSIVEKEYPQHLTKIERVLSDSPDFMKKIHRATSGRPIFIYQFIHLFVQEGFKESMLDQLKDSNQAQDFLYGRLYDYLSTRAQYLFTVISQATDSDRVFRLDVLAYLCSKCVPDQDDFDIALKELFDQRIIERYGDSQGRIYAPELFKIMDTKFAQQEDAFKDTVKNLLNSIGGKNVTGSIQEALLNEADQSRINGNMEETISRYRRVLKTKNAPGYIRRKALLNAASYYAITCLDPESASLIIHDFLIDFKDDAQVCSQYVDYLWQQEDSKKTADSFIRQFFIKANHHKKTDIKYFNLFAKGVGYCSNYDMCYRDYDNYNMRLRQYNNTINEFGSILFQHVTSDNFSFGRDANRHLVKVGLLQTIKLCREFYMRDVAKIKLVQNICKFASDNFKDIVYHKQFLDLQKEITELNAAWVRLKNRYPVGSIIMGRISSIKKYGLFVDFDEKWKGLIHISKLKEKEAMGDLYERYFVGASIKVKVIGIDDMRKWIRLQEL